MSVTVNFHGDLATLLRRQWRAQGHIQVAAGRIASIKDVVESFGLPHTEVGSLLVDECEVGFSHPVKSDCQIDVQPITAPWDIMEPCLLRPQPLAKLRFLVDINVNKLGRLLRMAGFDAASHPHWDDAELAACAEAEQRLLLSKDRGLLMRKQVHFGRLVRASDPTKQLQEIISLLGLHNQLQPLSRCLECNTPL
ncbi:MAG: Mut7-C RNAse domain-containing protein, partial [Thermodesulfobacteriota bacterium]